ncbi:MAG: MFS transporter, partial [Victivallales bacterium]|nr:MFS transporter [Victivallales bacterium]
MIKQAIVNKKIEIIVYISMGMLYFFSFFQRAGIPGTIFNQLQSDLKCSAAQITMLGACYLYVYAFMQPFIGVIADRFGGFKIISIGGVLLTISSITFPLLHNIYLLYICRVCIGFSGAFMYLSIVRELNNLFAPRHFTMLFGITLFFGNLGWLASASPLAYASEAMGWRGALLLVGFLTALPLIFVLFFTRKLKEKSVKPSEISFAMLKKALSNRYIWAPMLASMLNFTVFFVVLSIIGKKFLEDITAIASQQAAFYIFIATAAGIIMILLSGFISKWCNNQRRIPAIIATSLTFIATILSIVGIAGNFPHYFYLLLLIMFATASGACTFFVSAIIEVCSAKVSALTLGLCNTVVYVSIAFAGNICGWMLDLFAGQAEKTATATIYPPQAYITIFTVLAAMALTAIILSIFIKESKGINIADKLG